MTVFLPLRLERQRRNARQIVVFAFLLRGPIAPVKTCYVFFFSACMCILKNIN